MPEYRQSHFRGRVDSGSTDTGAVWIAAEDVAWKQRLGHTFRIRFCMQEQGVSGGTDGRWQLEQRWRNDPADAWSAWSNVNSSSSPVRCANGTRTDGQNNTQVYLSCTGTFFGSSCYDEGDGLAGIATQGPPVNGRAEIEYSIRMMNIDPGGQVELRATNASTVGWDQVPLLDIPTLMGSGFISLEGVRGRLRNATAPQMRGGGRIALTSTKALLINSVAVMRVTRHATEVLARAPDEVAPAALPATLLDLFNANWISGVQVHTLWQTDVVASEDGMESRRGLVGRPSRLMRAQLSGMSQAETARLRSNLMRMASQRTLMPLYPDQARVRATSSAELFVDTASYRFFVGGRVYAHNWHMNRPADVQLAEIAEILPDRLVLLDALATPINVGGLVYPALDLEIEIGSSLKLHTDHHGESILEVRELIGPSAIPSTSPFEALDFETHLGDPILDIEPDWGVVLDMAVVRIGREYQSGRSKIVTTLGDRPTLQPRLVFQFSSRALFFRFLRFFDSRQGRLLPWWLFSPQTLFSVLDATPDYIDVYSAMKAEDISDYVRHIGIVGSEGSRYIRALESVTDNVTSIRLTFDAPIADLEPSLIRRATTAHHVRFESDELIESWLTDEVCSVSVEATELLEETAAEVDDLELDSGSSDDSPAGIPDLDFWFDAGTNMYYDPDAAAIAFTKERRELTRPSHCDGRGSGDCPNDSAVSIWDDARSEPFALLDPRGPTKPYLEQLHSAEAATGVTGQKLIVFTRREINGGQPSVEEHSNGGFAFNLRRPRQLSLWDNALGWTIFFCAIHRSTGSIRFLRATDLNNDVIFNWDSNSIDLYETPAVIDTDIHVTGLDHPGADGVRRPHVAALRWTPSVATEAWYNGLPVGSVIRVPAALADAEISVAGAILFDFQVFDGTLLRDAGLGIKTFFNSAISFRRALTDAEMNAVGAYLRGRYGARWSDL